MAPPQTEHWSPKIESLCWSRSCRDKGFIEWVILLIKLSKTSGQSSCAVIALISQQSQTQPRFAARPPGVEPSTYHNSPLSSGYNLIVCSHTRWTMHQKLNKTIFYYKYYQSETPTEVRPKYFSGLGVWIQQLHFVLSSFVLHPKYGIRFSVHKNNSFCCVTLGDCVSFHPRNFITKKSLDLKLLISTASAWGFDSSFFL